MKKNKNLIVVKEDSGHGVKKFLELADPTLNLTPFFIQPYDSLSKHPSTQIFEFSYRFLEADFENNEFEFTDDEINLLMPWLNSSVAIEQYSLGRNWNKFSYDAVVRYCQVVGSYYDRVLKESNAKFVLDFESDNLVRAVLDIVCIRNSVAYIVFYSSRYCGRTLLCNGVLSPQVIETQSFDALVGCNGHHEKVLPIPMDLHRDEALFDERNSKYSLRALIRDIVVSCVFHITVGVRTVCIKRRVKNLISGEMMGLVFGGGMRYLLWKLVFQVRRFFYLNHWTSKIKRDFFLPGKYFYFALGQIVEGSDPNFSNGYLNDLICVMLVKPFVNTKKCPLLIKDHRSMAGDRRKWQIKVLDSSNVCFVYGRQLTDTDWKTRPIDLVKNANGVFTLSGSVGLEALIYGVPCFVFGSPLYKRIFEKFGHKFPSVTDINFFIQNPENFVCSEEIAQRSLSYIYVNSLEYSVYRLKRYTPRTPDWNGDFELANKHVNIAIKVGALV